MSEVNGTTGDDNLGGTAQGQSDIINGGYGNDTLQGYSGDDYLNGGRGNDLLIGGAGSDVMVGGLDADTFSFSAGHIGTGVIDWILDFSLRSGDQLQLLNSASGTIELVSVQRGYVTNDTSGGYDLQNGDMSTDLVFEIRNNGNGLSQKIVLLDSWASSSNADWLAYLQNSLHFNGGITNAGTITL